MSITEIAIKRPTLVVVFFTVLAILGITSYTKLNYELIPKLNIPVILISTSYPGASASEVESAVTKKIEDAISSVENINNIQSTSSEGISSVMIELESGGDASQAVEEAQRKISAIQSQLPDGANAPSINSFSSSDLPAIKLGVTSNLPPEDLYLLADNQIKAELSKLDGVAQVSLIGGQEREIKINIDRNKLDAYNLNISQVYQAVKMANVEMPTGNIQNEKTQYSIRLLGKVKSIDELKKITVASTMTGSYIYLADVAEVVDDYADQTTINRINGKNSIGIIVEKQSDANTVEVCDLVKSHLKELESRYADENLKFDIASDNSTYTLASANAVMKDLGLAVIFVAFVMFLFLHSLRNSFIVLVSIPASIVSVFIAMWVFDFSLNLLTLMALSLVIGILVDDSIVVLENINRHLQMGKNKRKAALDGRNEIGFTAVAITMVDIVIFVPLSLVFGMIGGMLREFSMVIVFSTLMSLIVSFTVTPLLASRMGKYEDLSRKGLLGSFSRWIENTYKKVVDGYGRLLSWSLNHRRIIYGTVGVLIIISVSLMGTGLIGSAFMNEGDQGEFIVKIEGEQQNTIYETTQLTQKVENLLLKKPEVVKVFSNIGSSSSNSFTGGVSEKNKSEITVTLVSKDKREISVSEYAAMVKKEIQQIPGIKVTATPTSMMGNADDAPIQILLKGPEMNRLFELGDSIMAIIKEIPGTNDIKLSAEKSKPELQVTLNREKMEQLGLNVQEVSSTLNMAFSGNSDLQYSDISDEFDINIRLDEFDRNNIEDVKTMSFKNSAGEKIELQDFADITQALGPNKLERYNRISAITINCSVYGRPVGTVGQEIKQAISEKIHSNDVSIEFKGQMERQSDAFGSLFTAILAALIFVYLVMVALYNSYFYPLVVMFSIPTAIIGALFALALTGESLTIYSLIGMIMLIGLVAKNAILLVDFTNKFRAEGMSIRDSLIEAGRERLRPILMTTLAMIFGMLPIALASGAGAESKNGLAWVVIGGLTSSLFFTLILVPSVYYTFEKYKEKIRRLFNRNKLKKVMVE